MSALNIQIFAPASYSLKSSVPFEQNSLSGVSKSAGLVCCFLSVLIKGPNFRYGSLGGCAMTLSFACRGWSSHAKEFPGSSEFAACEPLGPYRLNPSRRFLLDSSLVIQSPERAIFCNILQTLILQNPVQRRAVEILQYAPSVPALYSLSLCSYPSP